jgi:formamidopyrimidine-DNA glycosylase
VPELPEVETVVRELRGPLVGRRIIAVRKSRKKLRKSWSAKWGDVIVGHRIESIARRGKWIVIDLEGPQLVIHLGMTGQLTVTLAELLVKEHTHLVFALDDGRCELRFRDVRRFGCASYFADREAVERFFRESKLGPEPFQLDRAYWRQCLSGTSRNLKAILLDQRLVAGVGNIYADEALFEARLHPRSLGKNLSQHQADRLRKAVIAVLNRAIDARIEHSRLRGRQRRPGQLPARISSLWPNFRTLRLLPTQNQANGSRGTLDPLLPWLPKAQ